MAKLNDTDLKSILSKLIIRSLSNPEPAREIVDQALEENDFKSQVSLLCEAYLKPEFRTSTLISKSIDIRALPSLINICKREKLGIITIDFSGDHGYTYRKNDKINILILSGQINEFNQILLEACAVSGSIDEIDRYDADIFARALKETNPMIEVRGVKKSTYDAMKRNIKKLPYEMRFTLFPKKEENGKLNVGFFTKTEPIIMKKGSMKSVAGPFSIPKIASIILASSILERPEKEKQYESIKRRNQELMQDIIDMYYENDEPYYLVPAIIGKDGYNVFMDSSYEVDYYGSEVNIHELNDYIHNKFIGLNHTLVPMTVSEFEQYKNDIIIEPKDFQFYKEHSIPIYAEPEEMRDKQLSESLIEMLNRKREQVLLVSDDFNGQNLTNLENYIVASVHEIIMREDEDFTDWLEADEKLETREMELLSDIEQAYSMAAVYDSHDKVSELINNVRTELEAHRSIADHEELTR
ncbi:hypothetical protein [Lacrimispora amygdalina]|uniref:hypothetical protein n=1 Tax=Lacrimispora amygdalina TaxID=253257 RepID=UPI000BE357DE|nr:hypothetical protein [Lacrimispora amygdalina]